VPPLSKALAGSIAIELASASTAPRLTNREVGGFALRGLALGARQGGANQTPVNRTVILDLVGIDGWGVIGILSLRGRRVERLGRGEIAAGEILGRLDGFGKLFGTQRTLHRFTGCDVEALSARGRNLCPFVFVVRVTGRAARLFDLILDHGHDGMAGDASLAGTVLVQDVTEPKPALLH
jgi:hypothetical protein